MADPVLSLTIEIDDYHRKQLLRIANERKLSIKTVASMWVCNQIDWIVALERGDTDDAVEAI